MSLTNLPVFDYLLIVINIMRCTKCSLCSFDYIYLNSACDYLFICVISLFEQRWTDTVMLTLPDLRDYIQPVTI